MAATSTDGFRLYAEPFPTDYHFVQLAFIVDDLVATAEHWRDLYGVGPFYVLPRMTHEGIYHGERITVESQIAVSQAGPLQIELIQDFSDGPSVYKDLLRGAAGAHHIATVTRDYDAALGHYVSMGRPPVMELRPAGGGRVAYIDTSAEIGLFTEVIEYSDGFVRALSGTARRCATWDGTDPLRYLTG